MMSQQELNEAVHQQADPAYGGYEGNQTSSAHQLHQLYEPSFEQPLRDGPEVKVYPEPRNNKNMVCLMVFLIAMAMLVICAVLFIFFMGGIGGWIGFIVAAAAIFAVTSTAYDKIQ